MIAEHIMATKPYLYCKLTADRIMGEEHFAKMLEPVQPGDVLEFWSYNAGFCATGDGYQIKRNGEIISSTMFSCS